LGDYFAGVAAFQDLFLKKLDNINAKQLLAFNRLIMMDAGIIVEAFNLVSNQTIADQSKAMMEMSTPVTAIWEDILLLPIVGIIDSAVLRILWTQCSTGSPISKPECLFLISAALPWLILRWHRR
jgi:hypothetical protein